VSPLSLQRDSDRGPQLVASSSRLARWANAAAAVVAAVGIATACKDEPAPPAEVKNEPPAAEKKPAVDDKIASAMAAAEATARSESGSSNAQSAPPADGMLTAEAAARELAPGSPAQLVLGAAGGTPRVRLGQDHIATGAGPNGKLVLSYRSGGSVMPTIEFDLAPKAGPAGAENQPAAVASAGGAAGQASSVALRFALGHARPADDQPGRLPDNAKAEIAKLNGSYVELVAAGNGALLAQHQKVAGNNPDLEPLVTGSSESLASVILPYPDVPVGVGAFWMIKSRETVSGADVLAYRMVKLTDLGSGTAKLSVNTRRYLLARSLAMPGLPPHHVRRFESEGEATLSVKPGALYPQSADCRDSFMALVSPDDRPAQAVPIQSELTAKVSFSR
jgi:hypothetical protein